MKQSTASNLALVLALLAWPLCYYGVLSQLGDFVPATPRHVIDQHRAVSASVLALGVAALATALVLAGFAFSGARVRSGAAIAVCA